MMFVCWGSRKMEKDLKLAPTERNAQSHTQNEDGSLVLMVVEPWFKELGEKEDFSSEFRAISLNLR